MQRLIEIDSQILNSIQNCQLKHEMQFEENLAPEDKAAPLEKGDLLHKMMELYDGLMANRQNNCVDLTADTWSLLEESKGFQGREDFLSSWATEINKRNVINFCIRAGQFFASKMAIDTETSDNVMFQFNAYCEFYTNDPWETLAVEGVGSAILFENAILKIVYTGKMDRVVQQGNIIAPMDHKSSERRGSVSSMSNQFIGYCFLLKVNHIIIDKIGFQKTLKPAERFQRFILHVDEERIEEWKNNTILTILTHLLATVEDSTEAELYFQILRSRRAPLMNLTSCDKYSGCIYQKVCESNPGGRSWIKERDYIVRPKWDVGTMLETIKPAEIK